MSLTKTPRFCRLLKQPERSRPDWVIRDREESLRALCDVGYGPEATRLLSAREVSKVQHGHHSINSSARESRSEGKESPIPLAVLRLMRSWNLVG